MVIWVRFDDIEKYFSRFATYWHYLQSSCMVDESPLYIDWIRICSWWAGKQGNPWQDVNKIKLEARCRGRWTYLRLRRVFAVPEAGQRHANKVALETHIITANTYSADLTWREREWKEIVHLLKTEKQLIVSCKWESINGCSRTINGGDINNWMQDIGTLSTYLWYVAKC